MSHSKRTVEKNIDNQSAEELQLLADDKWITDALEKIRCQRNALLVERLELESIKASLIKASNLTPEELKRKHDADDEVPSTSTPMKRQILNIMRANKESKLPGIAPQSEDFNFDSIDNLEELNLKLTSPVHNEHESDNVEEEEYDSDETNQIILDIDMLVNEDTKNE